MFSVKFSVIFGTNIILGVKIIVGYKHSSSNFYISHTKKTPKKCWLGFWGGRVLKGALAQKETLSEICPYFLWRGGCAKYFFTNRVTIPLNDCGGRQDEKDRHSDCATAWSCLWWRSVLASMKISDPINICSVQTLNFDYQQSRDIVFESSQIIKIKYVHIRD